MRGETGAYLLLVRLNEERDIAVGSLGPMRFPQGTHVYVGSAMGGLEKRVARHLREEKRMRWHIDHLLASADGVEALLVPSPVDVECELASFIESIPGASPTRGFGCSDCRCPSHLYHLPEAAADCLRSLFPHSLKAENARQDDEYVPRRK
jgi:Uri superfamily endonuclease